MLVNYRGAAVLYLSRMRSQCSRIGCYCPYVIVLHYEVAKLCGKRQFMLLQFEVELLLYHFNRSQNISFFKCISVDSFRNNKPVLLFNLLKESTPHQGEMYLLKPLIMIALYDCAGLGQIGNQRSICILWPSFKSFPTRTWWKFSCEVTTSLLTRS